MDLRYGYPHLFAAYNAGPARFDHYLYDGASQPAETMAYLPRPGAAVTRPSGKVTDGQSG